MEESLERNGGREEMRAGGGEADGIGEGRPGVGMGGHERGWTVEGDRHKVSPPHNQRAAGWDKDNKRTSLRA